MNYYNYWNIGNAVMKIIDSFRNAKEADKLATEADEIKERTKNDLEKARCDVHDYLREFGVLKLYLLDNHISRYLDLIKKIKNIKLKGDALIEGVPLEIINNGLKADIKEIEKIYNYTKKYISSNPTNEELIKMGAGIDEYIDDNIYINNTMLWINNGLQQGINNEVVLGGIFANALETGANYAYREAKKELHMAREKNYNAKLNRKKIQPIILMLRSISKTTNDGSAIIFSISKKIEFIMNDIEEQLKDSFTLKINRLLKTSFRLNFKRLSPEVKEKIKILYVEYFIIQYYMCSIFINILVTLYLDSVISIYLKF